MELQWPMSVRSIEMAVIYCPPEAVQIKVGQVWSHSHCMWLWMEDPPGWWLKAEPCNRVVPQWQPVFYQGGTERRPVGFWGWVSSHKGPCQPLKAISTFLLPSSGQTHRSPAKSCSSHSLYFFQHPKASSGCSTLHPRGFKSLFKAKKNPEIWLILNIYIFAIMILAFLGQCQSILGKVADQFP